MSEQKNRLRKKLESDDVAIGAAAKVPTPTLVETYGKLGLDYVFLDFELGGKSPYDSHYLEGLVRAANSSGIEPLVRLPSGRPPLIRKVLDTGINSLLIPQVETADDVKKAIKSTRFNYNDEPGGRGIAPSRANWWGNEIDDFLEREDSTKLLGVIIENPTAVDNLDNILGIDGLGFVNIGQNDLTHSLGHGRNKTHSEVEETIMRIQESCLSMDVPLGNPPGTLTTKEAIEKGYQMISLGDEFNSVKEVFEEKMDNIRFY